MVKWTPIAEQSQPTEINDYTLIAKILDKEGEIIDESKFIVKTAIQDEDMSDYEAVDLGLSVKWASHNVGATKPEEYGGYYAWGEMDEKDEYSPFTYKFFSDLDNDDYWDEEEYEYLGSNISGTKYDIAHKKWGNGWRMPTLKEAKELINQCTWEEKVMNGIIGRLVTGPNGNSIFLPGSGYIVGPTEIFHKYNDHDGASYWCSEIHYIDTHAAYTFSFEDYEGNKGYTKVWMRDYGCPIRPVKNK